MAKVRVSPSTLSMSLATRVPLTLWSSLVNSANGRTTGASFCAVNEMGNVVDVEVERSLMLTCTLSVPCQFF